MAIHANQHGGLLTGKELLHVSESEALKLYKKKPKKAIEFLTNYTINWGDEVVKEAWKLGDYLWTKYDEKF
jgi:hypothetical protein